MRPRKPVRGRIEFANYQNTGIKEYDDNPLIQALPEILESVEAAKRIKVFSKFDPEERGLSPSRRRHCVERLSTFIIPLNKHLEVEEKICIYIRKGYLSRNIANGDHTRRIRNCMMRFERPNIADLEKERFNIPSPTSSGLGIIGISGAGKSKGIERILKIYPQIIVHPDYKERQLVWLKLDCPVSGTIKQLCLSFIQEIYELMEDDEYSKFMGYKTDELIRIMSSLALRHHLGVLVIDEIQYLNEAKSGGATMMLNFFNTLTNMIGVPIILIGTPKARHLFTKEFRNIKRITDQGSVDWDRLKPDSEDWNTLLRFIWSHQWTKEVVELNHELKDALYYESQGIPDLVIKIFKESQKRAIGSNAERISKEIIHSVAQDQFQLLQPALNALRSGKKTEMLKYLDIFMCYEPEIMIESEDREIFTSEYGIELDEALTKQYDNQRFSEVVNWLLDMNYSEEQASKVAAETKSKDMAEWKQAACAKILGQLNAQEAVMRTDAKESTTRRMKPKPLNTGLLHIIERHSKAKNNSFYSLMQKEGYVQNVQVRLGLE